MFRRDIVDQFLNDDGLSNSGSSEQADFSAFKIRLNEINDLDPGLKHLELGILFDECRRRLMDRFSSRVFDRTQFVDRLTNDIHHTAEGPFADRHRNRSLQIFGRHTAYHTLCWFQGDASDASFAQVLLHFDHHIHWRRHIETRAGDAQCRINGRLFALREFDIHGWTDNL